MSTQPNKIVLTYSELQSIVNIAIKAFIDNGKYYVSRNELEKMFGRTTVKLLERHKLINDSKKIGATKCQYVISDVIVGIEQLKKI